MERSFKNAGYIVSIMPKEEAQKIRIATTSGNRTVSLMAEKEIFVCSFGLSFLDIGSAKIIAAHLWTALRRE